MSEAIRARLSLRDARSGKLGLALSGGGFRAALFHVGILAQLAERDLLRYVAVISTVSGGSIIGAFYYLKVKQLLEGQRADDLQPDAAGFRQLMLEVEREFLAAVQENMRLTVFVDRGKNARMLGGSYTSTTRLSELFDELFYAPITGETENLLWKLPVNAAFDPGPANAPRFVVPELVLNTTSLNTGHQFQLTGRYVGESLKDSALAGVSAIGNLPRLKLKDPSLTARQRVRLERITVGDAVAASCCVPGIFDPFMLGGLYRDEEGEDVMVRLVDGGVFDNQGLVSLYNEGCTHFVCSDATDLLKWDAQPSPRMHNVLVRTNDIMMDRIRGELLDELMTRGGDKFVVLTLGDLSQRAFPEETEALVRALSRIRTDLDAFADTEASALMFYGHRLCGESLQPDEVSAVDERAPGGRSPPAEALPVAASPGEGEAGGGELASRTWAFEAIAELARDAGSRAQLLRQLEVGSRQFLKVFYMGKPLPYLYVVVPLLIPIALLALLIYLLPPVPTSAWVVLGLVGLTALAFSQNARIIDWLDQIESFRRFRVRLAQLLKPLGVTVVMGLVAAAVVRGYLRIFNPLYLRYGRLETSRHSLLHRLKRDMGGD